MKSPRSGTVLPDPLAPVIAGEALLALVTAAIRAGGRTDTVGSDGARREIELGLGTGDPHDQQLLKVADMADGLLRAELSSLHRAYRILGAPPVERKVPSVRSAIAETPAWLSRFMDLAERLRRRSPIARNLPQTLDLAGLDALPGGSAWKHPAFDHLFTREHRQALAIAVECLDAAIPAMAGRLDAILSLPFDRGVTAALQPSPGVDNQGDQSGQPELPLKN
jgi:hypothetical protein